MAFLFSCQFVSHTQPSPPPLFFLLCFTKLYVGPNRWSDGTPSHPARHCHHPLQNKCFPGFSSSGMLCFIPHIQSYFLTAVVIAFMTYTRSPTILAPRIKFLTSNVYPNAYPSELHTSSYFNLTFLSIIYVSLFLKFHVWNVLEKVLFKCFNVTLNYSTFHINVQ